MCPDGDSQPNRYVFSFRDRNGKNRSFSSINKSIIEAMVANELQREYHKMAITTTVVARLMYGQVPVEFHIDSEDNESLTVGEIKGYIDFAIEQGFTPPSYGSRSIDNIGQKGTVVSVDPVPNTKMFEVVAKLDNDTEFKWREFNATTFRVHDRIEVIKNDRGFKAGQLITDPPTQQELKGKDDIPF
jgi:hypothetical protein